MKKLSVLLIVTSVLNLNSLFGQGWVGNSPLNSLNAVNSTEGLTPIRVGIGISAPTALFHTNGTLRFQGLTQNNALNKILVMDNTDNIFWRDANSLTQSNGWLLTGNAATGTDFIGTTSNQDFRIRTNNIQKVVVTSAGNVGIGNNTPNDLLSLGANQLNFNPFDSNPIYSTFGTSGSSTIKGLGTIVMDFDNNNTDQNQNFVITHNGGTELFRISDNNGYTGIGSNSPSHRLTLPNDATGNNGKAIAVGWLTYSSEKFKENIETINNPLEIIKDLRGVEYNFKPEYGAGHSYGFIAEEVEKVLPDAIAKNSVNETIGLNYQEIIPILLEAIKKQQKEIDLLKIELNVLKKK